MEPPPKRAGVSKAAVGQMRATNDLEANFETCSTLASAAASPLAYYKFYLGEGGLRVPLVISGGPLASEERAGSIEHAFTWVTDIAPTILELTGAAPAGEASGRLSGAPRVGTRRGAARTGDEREEAPQRHGERDGAWPPDGQWRRGSERERLAQLERGALDRPNGERGVSRDSRGELPNRALEITRRNDAAHQAHAQRLVGGVPRRAESRDGHG